MKIRKPKDTAPRAKKKIQKNTKQSLAAEIAQEVMRPPLSENWLTGSLPPWHWGLTHDTFPGGGNLLKTVVLNAIRVARRTVKGHTEKDIRKIWAQLEDIFKNWFTKNRFPNEKKLLARIVANRRIYTHYDLYCHLRDTNYPPLINAFSTVPQDQFLAALILHDCADGLLNDIAQANYELILRNFNVTTKIIYATQAEIDKKILTYMNKMEAQALSKNAKRANAAKK